MSEIGTVRRFNRAVTRSIGALDVRFLGRNRSMAASRVLYEIGHDHTEVRVLRRKLNLDSGYMSRLLRGLEREGLVRTSHADDDRRVRIAHLSDAGLAELAELNRLSDAAANALLERLSASQRSRLTAAMDTVEGLLRATRVTLTVEPTTSPDARYCLEQYFTELQGRFDTGFDEGRSNSATDDELTPPNGFFVVARLDGTPVGCGALKCDGKAEPPGGEIKRMWVAQSARGLGLGKKLLAHLEDIARTRDLAWVRLETNQTLTEAIAMYRACGYEEVPAFNREPYAHHWFEKRIA
ncbi:MAG: helix-turn-helix domain-containing GNAT family N-acetyltransferase [Gammaproteobacteria bacterium]|nr:helix-turn-helix domain-containing GNAT family N-acetyltransferase [Gammaproteobacteria bacterium]